ncbi:MAG TPA: hypothetical protein VGE14_01075 [Marmoricola sp.]
MSSHTPSSRRRTGTGGSELRFTHVGLTEGAERYEVCRKARGFHVTTRLRRLVTTGTGMPKRAR